MKKKITITLILVLVPALLVILPMMQPRPEGYSISTEKDPAFDQQVERVFIVANVEEQLIDVFAHSFEHSMVSALQENGVDAVFKLADHETEAEATMRIDIKPLYLVQEGGHQAIVGTEFEVDLVHAATGKSVWHATGKVDYLKSKRTRRSGAPVGGILKEFSWHTTKAIARTFITEVNNQEPKPMYTATGGREYHGQRID